MKYCLLDILCCPYDKHFPLILYTNKRSYSRLHESWNNGANPHCGTYCGYHNQMIGNFGFSRYECNDCMCYEVEEGILFCSSCNRWYPIVEKIPSIMPDELRELDESEILNKIIDILPSKVLNFHQINSHFSSHLDFNKEVHDKKHEIETRSKNTLKPFQEDYIKRMEMYNILKRLSPKKRGCILDIGVGKGDTSLKYIHLFEEAVVADFVLGHLKKLPEKFEREKVKNFYPLQIDACLMPFRRGIFAKVISLQMLHHIPSPIMREKVLNNIKEVLKAEGEVFITVYNNNLLNLLARIQKASDYAFYAKKEGYYKNGIYYYNFSYREFKKNINKDFKIKEMVGLAPFMPKITKYFEKYERLSQMASIILEKIMLSHIFGRLLLVNCKKKD